MPPLVSTDRRQSIDTLRALALFGVIIMNILAMTMIAASKQVLAAAGPFDYVIGTAELLLVQGKARSCFAFLFGMGFGMAIARWEAGNRDVTRLHLRRMGVLLGFGLFNQAFLFFGDILTHYALLGALLPLARKWNDGALLKGGVLLILTPPLVSGLFILATGHPLPSLSGTGSEDTAGQAAAALRAYSSPYYFDTVAHNMGFQIRAYAAATAHRVEYDLAILGLFLLGLLAARHRLLLDVKHHRGLLLRVARWCLPIGFVVSSVHVLGPLGLVPKGRPGALVTAAFAGLPLMSFGMIAALMLWFDRGGERLQRLIAPAGRMTLTNYLLSSALGTWAFYGYGLGLIGSLNIAGMAAFALGLCVLLTAVSHMWLAAFHFGPAEWLWRYLGRTSEERPPLLRRPVSARMERV